MTIAKMLAAALWISPLAAIAPAAAQDVPVETPAPPPESTTRDQMKEFGGQLLMSLFDRIVQGKAKPSATPAPAAEVAEEPAEPVAEAETPEEPAVDPAVESEEQPAPRSTTLTYGKIRARSPGAGNQQVVRLPNRR